MTQVYKIKKYLDVKTWPSTYDGAELITGQPVAVFQALGLTGRGKRQREWLAAVQPGDTAVFSGGCLRLVEGAVNSSDSLAAGLADLRLSLLDRVTPEQQLKIGNAVRDNAEGVITWDMVSSMWNLASHTLRPGDIVRFKTKFYLVVPERLDRVYTVPAHYAD